MSEQLDLTIVYEPGEEGWIIASIPEVAGVFSQGRTREEARTNVIDALRLMLSPEPSDVGDRREREALHLTICRAASSGDRLPTGAQDLPAIGCAAAGRFSLTT